MAMAISRLALALLALAGAGLAGCGGAVTHAPTGARTFGWLGGGPAPVAWTTAGGRVGGGTLPRPQGYRTQAGDPGTLSFARLDAGTIVGYLNATPRQGPETLGGWTRFRVDHNAQEGDRDVSLSAAATDVRVGQARISCVSDSYRTSRSGYRELACLIARHGTSTVLVGAAPPSRWSDQGPVIERAIAGFVAS